MEVLQRLMPRMLAVRPRTKVVLLTRTFRSRCLKLKGACWHRFIFFSSKPNHCCVSRAYVNIIYKD